MYEQRTIIIDRGVYTSLQVDLTDYDFSGIQKVVMTFKNTPLSSEPLFTREFTEKAVHNVIITPAESKLLTVGAECDFIRVTGDNKCYKDGDNYKIKLREGCGQCQM